MNKRTDISAIGMLCLGLRLPVVILLALIGVVTSAEAQQIAVIKTDTLTSTRRLISGVRTIVKQEHDELNLVEFLVVGNASSQIAQLDSIRSLNPKLILTVGSAATKLAQEEFPSTPIVFAGVLYPSLSGFVQSLRKPGGNITGASLNIPIETQFMYFKKVVPGLKKVGVLYTEDTRPLVHQAKVIGRDVGIELVAIEVEHERDLPDAIDSLNRTVEGIWSLADPKLFNQQGTKYILIHTLRSGIPVMGFSRLLVESGALFGLDFDYKAIGRQAGHLVNETLNGVKTSQIPVTFPDIIWFHYNAQTADHLQISLPSELIAVAKEIYR